MKYTKQYRKLLPREYLYDEYETLRKTKSHRDAVNIMVKARKHDRKATAKELEYTGAEYTRQQRTQDTSGRESFVIVKNPSAL